MPNSSARAKCARASSLLTCHPLVMGDQLGISPPPYDMHPRARRETVAPVLPSFVYCMDLISSGRLEHGIDQVAIARRGLPAEARLQAVLSAPIHAARCRLRHDGVDSEGAKRFGHLVHFAGAAFPMNDNTANTVICHRGPIDTGISFC